MKTTSAFVLLAVAMVAVVSGLRMLESEPVDESQSLKLDEDTNASNHALQPTPSWRVAKVERRIMKEEVKAMLALARRSLSLSR